MCSLGDSLDFALVKGGEEHGALIDQASGGTLLCCLVGNYDAVKSGR